MAGSKMTFFILPLLGVDKWEVILQMENLFGKVHPSIIKVADLNDFGSRASLLIFFIFSSLMLTTLVILIIPFLIFLSSIFKLKK